MGNPTPARRQTTLADAWSEPTRTYVAFDEDGWCITWGVDTAWYTWLGCYELR